MRCASNASSTSGTGTAGASTRGAPIRSGTPRPSAAGCSASGRAVIAGRAVGRWKPAKTGFAGGFSSGSRALPGSALRLGEPEELLAARRHRHLNLGSLDPRALAVEAADDEGHTPLLAVAQIDQHIARDGAGWQAAAGQDLRFRLLAHQRNAIDLGFAQAARTRIAAR